MHLVDISWLVFPPTPQFQGRWGEPMTAKSGFCKVDENNCWQPMKLAINEHFKFSRYYVTLKRIISQNDNPCLMLQGIATAWGHYKRQYSSACTLTERAISVSLYFLYIGHYPLKVQRTSWTMLSSYHLLALGSGYDDQLCKIKSQDRFIRYPC